MKKRYIITGANGHLGKTIIELLENQKQEIRGLILPHEHVENSPHTTYYHGDITNIESLEALFDDSAWRTLIVIHTAGIIDIQKKVSSRLYDVNVNGTKNIISLCLKHHVKKFLYISSVHAIPETDKISILHEVDHFSPDTVNGGYAKTKAEASQAVLDAVKQGLSTIIVHPSGILGPHGDISNHLVQMVVQYIQGSLPACVNGGYDFVDVRDVAQGCLLALEKGKAGECYILSNRYYDIKDVLEMVRVETGRKKLSVLPFWLAKAAAPFMVWYAKARGIRPLYTSYTLDTLQSNAHFSHDKATKELGYYPRDLMETIKDTVTWYQTQ